MVQYVNFCCVGYTFLGGSLHLETVHRFTSVGVHKIVAGLGHCVSLLFMFGLIPDCIVCRFARIMRISMFQNESGMRLAFLRRTQFVHEMPV
jgi:hypothetical protein